jgi:hypothetical protein
VRMVEPDLEGPVPLPARPTLYEGLGSYPNRAGEKSALVRPVRRLELIDKSASMRSKNKLR